MVITRYFSAYYICKGKSKFTGAFFFGQKGRNLQSFRDNYGTEPPTEMAALSR